MYVNACKWVMMVSRKQTTLSVPTWVKDELRQIQDEIESRVGWRPSYVEILKRALRHYRKLIEKDVIAPEVERD